jgi:hypothetical protein
MLRARKRWIKAQNPNLLFLALGALPSLFPGKERKLPAASAE